MGAGWDPFPPRGNNLRAGHDSPGCSPGNRVSRRVSTLSGTRVLESNVRSFLSTRGKVNKGIRGTLIEQPEMFLSYNNGVTATASDITIEQSSSGPALVGVRDLQIVNGGQPPPHSSMSTRTRRRLIYQMSLFK